MPEDSNKFESWLRRGLGRAVLFLRDRDATPYRDLILHACLNNLAYDPQFEGNRALYMFDIVQATGEPEWYAAKVRQALETTEEDDSRWQLFDLAGLFAQHGDEQARQAMYARFKRDLEQEDTMGATALIRLDGLDAFLFVIEEFTRSPLSEEEQREEG